MTDGVLWNEKAQRTAEDDAARSRFVFEFVRKHQAGESINRQQQVDVPKVIVQYWHNKDEIPPDVQECMDSWLQLQDSSFRRVLFSDASAAEFVRSEYSQKHITALGRCHHPAMRADYFRLCYLVLHGGFYVDADEMYQSKFCDRWFDDGRLKLQPLCYDKVSNKMVPPQVFLNSDHHNAEWIYYFNNNPIIGPKDHPVLSLALERATDKLVQSKQPLDIQSTTGPGNLSASLVAYALQHQTHDDITVLSDWESTSVSRWPLSYRDDERNWRLWNPKDTDSRI